jgi:hypothetical protein
MTNMPTFPCRDPEAEEAQIRNELRALGFDVALIPLDRTRPARLLPDSVYRGADRCAWSGLIATRITLSPKPIR